MTVAVNQTGQMAPFSFMSADSCHSCGQAECPAAGSALRCRRLEKEFPHHEFFKPRIIPGSGGQRDGSSQTLRHPEEIFLRIFANDGDHPADHGNTDVAVVAPAHINQLFGVAVDIVVPAVEDEFCMVGTQAFDLEHAAALSRVVAESAFARRTEIAGNNALPAGLLIFNRSDCGC